MPVDEEGLARAREAIEVTPIMRFLGFRPVACDDPEAYCVEMDLRPEVLNRAGIPHGGAVATLLDHTGGFAAILLCGRGGSTSDLHIRYLEAERSGTYRAEARVVREGGRLIVLEVRATCDDALIAIASMTIAPMGESRTARAGVEVAPDDVGD